MWVVLAQTPNLVTANAAGSFFGMLNPIIAAEACRRRPLQSEPTRLWGRRRRFTPLAPHEGGWGAAGTAGAAPDGLPRRYRGCWAEQVGGHPSAEPLAFPKALAKLPHRTLCTSPGSDHQS